MPPDPPRMVGPSTRRLVPSALDLVNITYGKSRPPHTKFPAAASERAIIIVRQVQEQVLVNVMNTVLVFLQKQFLHRSEKNFRTFAGINVWEIDKEVGYIYRNGKQDNAIR